VQPDLPVPVCAAGRCPWREGHGEVASEERCRRPFPSRAGRWFSLPTYSGPAKDAPSRTDTCLHLQSPHCNFQSRSQRRARRAARVRTAAMTTGV